MLRNLVPICFITFFTSSMYAATSAVSTGTNRNQTSTALQKVAKKKSSKTSVKIELSADSNLKDQSSSEYDANTSLYFEPSYQITRKATLRLRTGIDKALVDEKKATLSNTTITLARSPISISNDTKLSATVFGVLPTNTIDRQEKTLQGGTGTSATVTQNTSLLGQALSVSYTLSALKNYHEFTRGSDESANISHRLRHILSIDTQLNKKMSASIYGFYQTGWTYDSVMKQAYRVGQSLSYALGDNTEATLDHINEGAVFRANGVDSNVSVYDANTSVISIGLTKVF